MVTPVSITHQFNGDSSAADMVDAADLDTQLGNLATTLNAEIVERQRTLRDGSGLAPQVVRFPSLHPEVTALLVAGGLVPLQSAAVVALTNVASLTGLQTVDGYTLIAADRILLVGQTNPLQNGLWVAAAGAWTRPTDSVSGQALAIYCEVNVINGTAQSGSTWILKAAATVDTSAQTWVLFSGVGSVIPISRGGTGATDAATARTNLGLGAQSITQSQLASDVQYRVDTIAALKALTVSYNSVLVLGYYAAGDGGGGIFRWNAADTNADNLGTVIIPASAPGTGRWNRVIDSALFVRWFGAKGDGATDDSTAIQAAVTAAAGRALFLGVGTFIIATAIVASTEIRLFGVGRTGILKRNTAGNILEIGTAGMVSRLDGAIVDGVAFTSPGNVGVQSAIRLVSSTPGTKQNIAIQNCYFSNFAAGANACPLTSSSAVTRADYARAWYTGGTWAAYLAQTDTPEICPTTASKAIEVLSNSWTIAIDNNYVEACNIGIYAANLAGPVDYLTITRNTINSGGVGILCVNVNTPRIQNNTIEFNYCAITVYGCRLTTAALNQLEGNDLHHIYLGEYTGNQAENSTVLQNKFQPRNGVIANQQNDVVVANADTVDINRNGYGGVNTAAQDANHGWNILVRSAASSRVNVDTERETSDGAVQITGSSKVEIETRKIGGASRQINRRRISLSMQDSLNTQFEPFFYRHQTDINGLAAPATYSLDFVVPTGLKLYVVGYGIEVTSLVGGGVATQLVGSIVQGAGNNIVRLTSVTLSNAAAVNERSVVNIAADVNRLFPAGTTLQFQTTIAATGPATYTVRPIVWGYLCP